MIITFAFILLLSYVFAQNQIIVSSVNGAEYSCGKNILSLSITVSFSEKLEENIPFILEMVTPQNLKFKCLIDFKSEKIVCLSFLTNNCLILSENSILEFPYKFPEVKGIVWEYDSFVKKIYRNVLPISNCVAQATNDKLEIITTETDLQATIEDVTSGECFSSEKFYSFDMKIKLNGGQIKKELTGKPDSFQLMHNIFAPIFLGNLTENEDFIYTINEKYKLAECNYSNEINAKNFDDDNGGIVFKCKIPLIASLVLKGPIEIQPFADYVYINTNQKTEKLLKINFGINKSNIDNKKTKKGNKLDSEQNINYHLINGKKVLFICPDKPIFNIKSYDYGIVLDSMNLNTSDYAIFLNGYVDNLAVVENNNLIYLSSFQYDITFDLVMKNNLIEDIDSNKHKIKCTLSKDQEIHKNKMVVITCEGKKPTNQYNNSNLDISLSWNLPENNKINDIIINWPTDKTSKNFFSYEIKGISFLKRDYGCFNSRFYFYFNIEDLKYEPNINFYLPLFRPKNSYADCKVYNRVTLKCSIDLRLKRLSKNDFISLPRTMTREATNGQGNKVLFKLNLSLYDFFSNYLIVEEGCGDFIFIGTLKDAGFSFWQIILIVIGSFLLGLLVIFGGIFCIIYKVTHRNRKGAYFRHAEENSGINDPKALPNTSKPNIK